MSYNPTTQQTNAIETLRSSKDGDIILIDAKAGSGKTSLAQLVVYELKPKKVLYTAFNKAIVEEGTEKFPSNVECRTLHALALSYVKPKLGIEPFTYLCIKEHLAYFEKAQIIKGIDEFFRSGSSDMYEYFKEYFTKPKLIPFAERYVEKMINDEIPVTFNFLLKYFHLLLKSGEVKPNYEMVIIDELQDSTAVALEIFKYLPAKYRLGLGDQFQSIYGFMNLVNGFEVLEDTTILPLTKSFRCSTTIAESVQQFGQEWLSKDFTFEGTETPEHDGKTAYITATNASIIQKIIELHKINEGYVLTRPLKDIFACPLALTTARAGKPILHKQYKFLEKEYKNFTLSSEKSFFSYLIKEVNDEEINSSIKLLNKLAAQDINIFSVLADAKKSKKNPKTLVSTFFSCKGLGFETVYIQPDIHAIFDNIKEKIYAGEELEYNDHTMLKGIYVACTRARVKLINSPLTT